MATLSKEQVTKLRKLYVEERKSAREIAEHFGVSLDAVYYAMRRHKIPRRSTSEINKILFSKKPLSYSLKRHLSSGEQSLKLAGVMLYWSEGYKTKRSAGIDFANSDTYMLQVFINFLRVICGIDEARLRIYLYCHDVGQVEKLIRYWSTQLKIPKSQFTKPYVNPRSKVEKKDKMPYGLVHIRYMDKKLLQQVLTWIEEYKQQLCVGGRAVNYTRL